MDVFDDALCGAVKATTDPGTVDPTEDERAAFRRDFEAARERVGDVSTLDFSLPNELELIDRHQWIDRHVEATRAVMDVAELPGTGIAGLDRLLHTIGVAPATPEMSAIAAHVLGSADPTGVSSIFIPGGSVCVVYPNLTRVSGTFDANRDRFRRWIVYHQVAFAATFDSVPWLETYVRELVEAAVTAAFDGTEDTRLDVLKMVGAGYVSLLVSRMVDGDDEELRRTFHGERWNRDLATRVVRTVSGSLDGGDIVESGREFLEAVEYTRNAEAVDAVWDRPENLPTLKEMGCYTPEQERRLQEAPFVPLDGVDLAPPSRWLERVDL